MNSRRYCAEKSNQTQCRLDGFSRITWSRILNGGGEICIYIYTQSFHLPIRFAPSGAHRIVIISRITWRKNYGEEVNCVYFSGGLLCECRRCMLYRLRGFFGITWSRILNREREVCIHTQTLHLTIGFAHRTRMYFCRFQDHLEQKLRWGGHLRIYL